MSFIGNVPAEAYSPVVKDTFSGNSSTTDFTLSIPATTNSVEVFVENVQQEPTTAYTISGTTLSFTAAPVTGTNNIYVIHRGPAVQQIVPPAGVALNPSTVNATGDISTDTGVNTDTISEKTAAAGVTIDGVLLKDGDVTATGVTVTGEVTATNTLKAFVNFKGTATVTNRDDFNVSSISDTGTGQYTVNFSTAIALHYCVTFVGSNRVPNLGDAGSNAIINYTDMLTTSCKIAVKNVEGASSGSAIDVDVATVGFFTP